MIMWDQAGSWQSGTGVNIRDINTCSCHTSRVSRVSRARAELTQWQYLDKMTPWSAGASVAGPGSCSSRQNYGWHWIEKRREWEINWDTGGRTAQVLSQSVTSDDRIRIWHQQIDWDCLIIHLKSLSIIAFCRGQLKINSWHHFCWQSSQDGYYMQHWMWGGRRKNGKKCQKYSDSTSQYNNPGTDRHCLWKVNLWVSIFHADIGLNSGKTRKNGKFPELK